MVIIVHQMDSEGEGGIALSGRSALARHRAGGGAWWETAISRVAPNEIEVRGEPVERLIGRLSFTEMVALLIVGRRLTASEVRLLDAALVAGADHGPLAPSIAAARMAATCGVTFNSAVATGINMLGDHHGGAVEQFMRLLEYLAAEPDLDGTASRVVAAHRARREAVPGYGHQLHDRDPRRTVMIDLVEHAAADGAIDGRHLASALAVEAALAAAVGREVPLNVDGLAGIVYLELGFPAAVAKGLFSLSRGAGIVAHALEEQQQGSRIKGPCPPEVGLVRYTGPSRRTSEPVDADHEREFWSTLGEAGVAVFWGFDHQLLDGLDAEARRALVTLTQSAHARDERTAILERIGATNDSDLLQGLCALAR
jgi:citrate synthase